MAHSATVTHCRLGHIPQTGSWPGFFLSLVSVVPPSGFTIDATGAPSGWHSVATGIFILLFIYVFILSLPLVPSQVEHLLQVEEVRLRPAVDWGRRPLPVTEGLVEVKLPEGWSQVCDKGWSAHNSHVVCGMLGFPGAKRVNLAFYRCGAQGCLQTLARMMGVGGSPGLREGTRESAVPQGKGEIDLEGSPTQDRKQTDRQVAG